ncbi:hypothetical protein [Nostoc sp.]
MKVIIDTSIVVSAAIADKNPEAVILFVIANYGFEWVVSANFLVF